MCECFISVFVLGDACVCAHMCMSVCVCVSLCMCVSLRMCFSVLACWAVRVCVCIMVHRKAPQRSPFPSNLSPVHPHAAGRGGDSGPVRLGYF